MVCTNVKVQGLKEKAYSILLEQKIPVFLQASQTSVSASTVLCGFAARLHYLSLGAPWDGVVGLPSAFKCP